MTIAAIETHYGGCRFRSRLEARWAVFFDRMHWPWIYEPQGFELSWRLSLVDGPLTYLPDFHLPGLRLWVEVKGVWASPFDCHKFINAAAALAGCPLDGYDGVMVLGPVPRPMELWQPWILHTHKGDLVAQPLGDWGKAWCGAGQIIASDVGGDIYQGGAGHHSLSHWQEVLLAGAPQPHSYAIDDALTAARSARFEYGQVG